MKDDGNGKDAIFEIDEERKVVKHLSRKGKGSDMFSLFSMSDKEYSERNPKKSSKKPEGSVSYLSFECIFVHKQIGRGYAHLLGIGSSVQSDDDGENG